MELKDDWSEKVQYDYVDYPIYIHRDLLSLYPNYEAPIHWHDDVEFIAVLSGVMQYNINGEYILLKENEGVFVNSRQLHFGVSLDRKECDFICVILHPLLLCVTPSYERNFVLPVLRNRNIPYVKLKNEVSWQKKIYDNICTIHSVKNDAAAPLKVQNLFWDIWTNLYENISTDNHSITQNTDLSILKNMMGFVQQNYGEKIALAEIAAAGAVGQSKCCKLFSKYIRCTPNTYLTQYRLGKSTELLKHTDLSILEIANAVGFSGSSYYAESFRKWSGKSPSEYRKRNA